MRLLCLCRLAVAGLCAIALLVSVPGFAVGDGSAATSPPKVKVNPKDGAEMILIPAGTFFMGTTQEQADDIRRADTDTQSLDLESQQPRHAVYLDGYYVYKTPVTVAQYRESQLG